MAKLGKILVKISRIVQISLGVEEEGEL